jgi:O-antigen ligase
MNKSPVMPYSIAPRTPGAISYVAIAFIILVSLVGALLMGVLAAFFPPLLIFILLAFIAFAVFAWKLPEYSALILLAGLAGVFPSQIVGHTSTLIGISALVIVVGIKYFGKRDQWAPVIRPLIWPYIALLFMVGVGTARALLYQTTAQNHVFDEVVPFLYWLLFPVIALSLDSPRRLKSFLIVTVVLGTYIAVGQIIQAIFQVQLFFGGRFEIAETLGREYAGVARSITPGTFVLLFGLLVCVALYIGRAGRLALIPLIALFVLGLMFTFGRTLMGVTLLVMLWMGWMLGAGRIIKLGIAGVIVGAVAIGGLAVLKPEIYYAMADRVSSVETEIRGGRSLNYRYVENRTALAQIEQSPLFGIGLGRDYRQGISEVLENVDVGSRYIHNGYLYVLLKQGVITFLMYAWFYAAALMYARATFKGLHEPQDRAVVVAVFALMLMPILTSLTRPDWVTPASTAVYALCLGLLVAYRRHKASGAPHPDPVQ